MKMLMCGFAVSLSALASDVNAEQILTVDGNDYPLSSLLENCQSITDDPAAQIDCFSAISRLLDEQTGEAEEEGASVTEALDTLRTVAQYQDSESGLLIAGSDCNIHIVYFNNYFHISRRNISTIDLFSAVFDASKLQYDRTVQVQGAQAPLFTGFMDVGATAAMRGGVALESTANNFAARSPGMSIDVYANEVVGQLPPTEAQTFNFVLVHPARNQASGEIWAAFEGFVTACRASPPTWSAGVPESG
ncbi:hypothetical protein BC777_3620 [Yoonia maricola]|uniref:Uncharacterized protein n=1 Tax=Yoonia maricola TaxID=420999 RepID=A0A2M8W0X4_9RHOB|nr:hypothetical protein [Yoonia maricola]PJI84559.1 hypothetical protein BC777_3620 [Yoonia maricola]